MWIISSIVILVPCLFIILAIVEEYRWAKSDGRSMFRDKFGNWNG
jgi:hypothetical protein